MMVRSATPDVFDAWLDLAREVEHLFGPMADVMPFRDGLMAALTGGAALCIDDESPGLPLAGGVVIDTITNAIAWLAVAERCRGRGYGGMLVEAAIGRLDRTRPITVQTFAPSCTDGTAARRLYGSVGFADAEEAEPTPAGVATVIMRRPAG